MQTGKLLSLEHIENFMGHGLPIPHMPARRVTLVTGKKFIHLVNVIALFYKDGLTIFKTLRSKREII